MSELTSSEWDVFLSGYPDAHLLQTGAWGELKSGFGWSPTRIAVGQVGAQILFRRLPLGLSVAYIPKGPVGLVEDMCLHSWDPLWPEVDDLCHRHKAIFLKVEPDLWEGREGEASFRPPGFSASPTTIQPPRTLLINLEGDDDQVLARMKQKTRYNIRLALKKGVVVRPSSDLPTFHTLIQITGGRDAFGVHSLEYYRRAYELFHPYGACELLVAEYAGEPLGALMVFARGRRAWYLYGASGNEHRERMPTYLLQWEAMRWARSQGCREYDLWGVPDDDEATLEADFSQRSDGLWGVYRFKRGFGGQLARALGPWDRVYQPGLYHLYGWVVKTRGGAE